MGVIGTHFVLWVPCPCFPLINHYFYKKLGLYILLPNIYLGMGFEFGPQRIGDLAIVSVVRGKHLPGAGWNSFYFTVQICILSKLQFRSMIRPGKVRTSNFFYAVGKYFRAGMFEICFLRLPKEWSIYENSSSFLKCMINTYILKWISAKNTQIWQLVTYCAWRNLMEAMLIIHDGKNWVRRCCRYAM